MVTLSRRRRRHNADFQLIADSFLGEAGLPLSSVLPPAEIERIFRRHDVMFGGTYNAIYGPAIVLWAFLAQVLSDGKMASCAAAVARIANFRIANGQAPPSNDTGDYCTARAKLNERALHELAVEAAGKIEQVAPDEWLWHGRNGLASPVARLVRRRRHTRGGPLLLFVHDARHADAARRRCLRANTPTSAR